MLFLNLFALLLNGVFTSRVQHGVQCEKSTFQSQLHIYDNIEQVLEYSSFVDALQPTRKSF